MPQRPSEGRKRVRAYEVRGLLVDFGDMLVQRDDLYDSRELEDWASGLEALIGKALTVMERRMR